MFINYNKILIYIYLELFFFYFCMGEIINNGGINIFRNKKLLNNLQGVL